MGAGRRGALAVLAAGLPRRPGLRRAGHSCTFSRLASGLQHVEHSPDLLPARGDLGLEFRCCALFGKALFLYVALLFIVILTYDAIMSFIWVNADGSKSFGMGVGSLVITCLLYTSDAADE